MSALLVVGTGAFASVQDLGRSGVAHYGVARSGAADAGSLRLANRLVGNSPGAAGLEITGGRAVFEALRPLTVAVTGARCTVLVGDRVQGPDVALQLAAGDRLRLGPVTSGLRVYVAVRGGLVGVPALGSAAYDQLGDLGTPPLRAGDRLAVGDRVAGAPVWEPVPVRPRPQPVTLVVVPGPRDDWLHPPGIAALAAQTWTVRPELDRTGLRLAGEPLVRRSGELLSEGVVPGSVQLPTDGLPILLGPDAGVTGGYPVIGVVLDLDALGQLAPGDRVRFRLRPQRSL